MTAGACDINFVMFVIASIVGRGMRFFFIGGLIWKFGAPIKAFIDKYFNLLATLFTILLVGFTVLVLGVFGSGDEDSDNTATTEQMIEVDSTLIVNDSIPKIPCDTLDL